MRARKNKRQHNDSLSEQRARVVLSGHSTGSQHSEMEAMSHQVSIDAGQVPQYQINSEPIDTTDHGFGVTAELNDREAMGSPDLYGPNPPLTGQGDQRLKGLVDIEEANGGFKYRKLALWSSVGVVTGALGYLAYKYYGDRQN